MAFHPQVYRGAAAPAPASSTSSNSAAVPAPAPARRPAPAPRSSSGSSSSSCNLPVHGLDVDASQYPRHPAFSSASDNVRLVTASQYADLVYQYSTTKTSERILFPWLHGADAANTQQAANFGFVHGARCPVPRYRALTTVYAPSPRSKTSVDSSSSVSLCSSTYAGDLADSVHSLPALGQSVGSAPMASSYSTDSFSSSSTSHSTSSSSVPSKTGSSTSIATSVSTSSVHLEKDNISSTFTASMMQATVSMDSITSESTTSLAAEEAADDEQGPEPVPCLLTSAWLPDEIFSKVSERGAFIRPNQPSGISFRNYRMQGPKMASISDVFVYSEKGGLCAEAIAVARRAREAIDEMRAEREAQGERHLVPYNVFIVVEPFSVFEERFPYLVAVDSKSWARNKHDFLELEASEGRLFTKASEIAENVFLGNTFDVPTVDRDDERASISSALLTEEQYSAQMDRNPHKFSICIEAKEQAYMCSARELRERERYLEELQSRRALEGQARKRVSESRIWYSSSSSSSENGADSESENDSDFADFTDDKENFYDAVSDADMAASPSTNGTGAQRNSAGWRRPAQFRKSKSISRARQALPSPAPAEPASSKPLEALAEEVILLESYATCQSLPYPNQQAAVVENILEYVMWMRAQARPALRTSLEHRGMRISQANAEKVAPRRILIQCVDGYTDSSLLALAYVMYDRVCSLPEAYLWLQNDKQRCFFVYPADVPVLQRLESRILGIARTQGRSKFSDDIVQSPQLQAQDHKGPGRSLLSRPSLFSRSSSSYSASTVVSPRSSTLTSASFMRGSSPSASPSNAVAHAWFYDSRFEGHFPSRILDHVYLGSLAHASNALMLKELGITHVLSVGESALVPPARQVPTPSSPSSAAKARTPTNSLWLEQSLGNIKVLDIQNIQDDGVDPVLPHLLTALDFIDECHAQGGKVLVHCRVGVSRSATLVIAYAMKELDLSLVEAYMLVRARRLNILIQPTILFAWTLHTYEEEIRDSGFTEDGNIRRDRSGRLSWPQLATEMANLNHKYLGC